jgi:hypothetical protein
MDTRFDLVTIISATCVAAYVALALGYLAICDLGLSRDLVRGAAMISRNTHCCDTCDRSLRQEAGQHEMNVAALLGSKNAAPVDYLNCFTTRRHSAECSSQFVQQLRAKYW